MKLPRYIHSLYIIYFLILQWHNVWNGGCTLVFDASWWLIIYDSFQKVELDSTDDYVGTSEIEIPEFGSNIAGRGIYNPVANYSIPSCSQPFGPPRSFSQPSCVQMIDSKVLDAMKLTPDTTAQLISQNRQCHMNPINQMVVYPPGMNQISPNQSSSKWNQINHPEINQMQMNSKLQFAC